MFIFLYNIHFDTSTENTELRKEDVEEEDDLSKPGEEGIEFCAAFSDELFPQQSFIGSEIEILPIWD